MPKWFSQLVYKRVVKCCVVMMALLVSFVTVGILFFSKSETYASTTSFEFQSGKVQSITLKAYAQYSVELKGAGGGGGGGGKGGLTKATFRFTKDTLIYIVVGGAGSTSTTQEAGVGGWPNGGNGGSGGSNNDLGGGGGGGYTAINLTNTYSLSSNATLLVAGGGGGSNASNYAGGSGGGEVGGVSGCGTGNSGGDQTNGGNACDNHASGRKGGAGGIGSGGSGGNSTSNVSFSHQGGGGGGSGWRGGGGGGGASGGASGPSYCGGAGGSGYITKTNSGVSNGSMTNGGGAAKGANGSVTITADVFTITRDNNGGTGPTAGVKVTSGESYSLGKPTWVGYTFVGWWSAPDGGTKYTDAEGKSLGGWIENENKTVYAHWIPNTYQITFNLNGGEWVGGYTPAKTYSYSPSDSLDTAVFLPTASEIAPRVEFYFAGWYDNEKLTGDEVTSFLRNTLADKTFWAKWLQKSHLIRFNSRGGSEVLVVHAPPDDVVLSDIEPNAPIQAGYDFAGWYQEPSLKTQFTFQNEVVPENGITLYAKWTETEYKIIYDFAGGMHNNESGRAVYRNDFKLDVPSLANYDFFGWYNSNDEQVTDNNGNGYNNTMWNIAVLGNEITVHAVWTPSKFEIKFNTDGGGEIPSVWHTFNEKIPIPRVPKSPTKRHSKFIGWYTPEGALFDFYIDVVPGGGTTLTARWGADVAELASLIRSWTTYLSGEFPSEELYFKFSGAMQEANVVFNNTAATAIEVEQAYNRLYSAAIDCGFVEDPNAEKPSPSLDEFPFWIIIVGVVGLVLLIAPMLRDKDENAS